MTYDFDRSIYILFCSPINLETIDENIGDIEAWFYKRTELPEKKIEINCDQLIPDEFVYIVGYIGNSKTWSVLAKLIVSEYVSDKSKLH